MASVILFGILSSVLVVAVWFFGLCTLMVGAWCAVDRYNRGSQKDRRVIGSMVLLLAVVLWALTTFR
jgi:hypothetical protein